LQKDPSKSLGDDMSITQVLDTEFEAREGKSSVEILKTEFLFQSTALLVLWFGNGERVERVEKKRPGVGI
jgi:hypothetical protein